MTDAAALPHAAHSRGLVLVVDDAPQIRRMVRFTMESAGRRVIEAADGAEAWRLVNRDRPNIVIMDITMSGQDGLEICRLIRAEARLADLPVIILSAGGSERASDAMMAGATAFMNKPFSPAALLDLVATFAGTD